MRRAPFDNSRRQARERTWLGFLHVYLYVGIAAFWPLLTFNIYFTAALFATSLAITAVTRFRFFPVFGFPLIAVTCAYIGLSYAHLLPRGWTELYQADAIPQQSLGYILLPFLISANAYCFHCLQSGRLAAYPLIIAAVFGSTIVNTAMAEFFPEGTGDAFEETELGWLAAITIGPLSNNEAIQLFLILLYISTRSNWYWGTLANLAFIAICVSAQSTLVVLYSLGLRLFPIARMRLLLGLAVVSMFAMMPIMVLYWEPLWDLDPNTGIRGKFWLDAFSNIVDAWFLGTGYGTEFIQGVYFLTSGIDVHIRDKFEPQAIYIGLHNEFVQVLFRTGFVGLGVLLYGWFMSLPTRNEQRLDGTIFYALTLTLGLNVAISSFNMLFGTALFWGWAHYRNMQARRQQSSETERGLSEVESSLGSHAVAFRG